MGKKPWYKASASETEEGKKRLEEYYSSLGRFVDRFSKAELAVAFTLWHYTKVPHSIARAIFSGFNIDTAISTIKRLAQVTGMPNEKRTELEWLFTQLGSIRKARNDILHYGAINVAEGEPSVTNAIKALTEDRIEHFPVSPIILAKMSADLRKIIVRLHLNHMGRPKVTDASLKMFEEVLRDTWQYKHQPRRLQLNPGATQSQLARKRVPKPAPPP
jgi:hypothetical protein